MVLIVFIYYIVCTCTPTHPYSHTDMEASEHPVSLMHNSGLEMEDVCVLQRSISQVVWHRCGVGHLPYVNFLQ